MLTAVEKAHYRWHDRSMDNEVIVAFTEYQQSQHLSPATIRNRRSILRTLAMRTGLPLLEQTQRSIRTHLGRSGIAAGTARTERNAIVRFYDYCVLDGYLETNPAARIPAVKAPKGEPRPFARAQIEELLRVTRQQRSRAMLMLGYYQGFRVSQIARVHGNDIDMLTRTIRTVAKGNKERRLPAHPQIMELAVDMPTGDWWFPSPKFPGKPIDGHAVTDRLTLIKKRAGIDDPRLTPHSLRHSFGTDLVDAGVDIRVIQELMLHEDLSTTQIYTKVSEQRKREAIEQLGAIDAPYRSPLRAVA